MTSVSLGGGLRFDLLSWLSATVGVSGGYFFSFLNDFSTSGGNPFVSAEAGVILLPSPWHVSVGASYRYYFGLYSGLSAFIGLSMTLLPSCHDPREGTATASCEGPAFERAASRNQKPPWSSKNCPSMMSILCFTPSTTLIRLARWC